MSTDHPQYHKPKQLNLNTLVVGICFALLGFLGKVEFERVMDTQKDQGKTLAENNQVLTRVEATQGGVLVRLSNLENSVRLSITRSEFQAEISRLTLEIKGRDSEILELKKEVEALRRARSVVLPPKNNDPYQ